MLVALTVTAGDDDGLTFLEPDVIVICNESLSPEQAGKSGVHRDLTAKVESMSDNEPSMVKPDRAF